MDKESGHEAYVEDTHGRAQRLKPKVARKQPKHPRKERRDKGKKLIKPRDLVVLLWIAQQYAARLDHVQELLSRMPGRGGKQVSTSGLTLSAVLQVVDRWVTLGLVEYKRIYDWRTRLGLVDSIRTQNAAPPPRSTYPCREYAAAPARHQSRAPGSRTPPSRLPMGE